MLKKYKDDPTLEGIYPKEILRVVKPFFEDPVSPQLSLFSENKNE